MIDVAILFKGVRKNGEAVIDTTVEIHGPSIKVKYEMAALLESLWDVDDGKTLCDAMDIHQDKIRSQKA